MKKVVLSLVAVLIVGVLSGYGLSWLLQLLQEPEAVPESIMPAVTDVLPERNVLLYFTDPGGSFLRPERHTIPGCETDQECVSALLTALIRGPQEGDIAVLPEQTRVLGVTIADDLVTLDFSRQLVDLHPGGVQAELLTVYSLVNSIIENFPYLHRVQILIEGQRRETLKGHVHMERPFEADLAYLQTPAAGPAKEQKRDELSIESLIEGANKEQDN